LACRCSSRVAHAAAVENCTQVQACMRACVHPCTHIRQRDEGVGLSSGHVQSGLGTRTGTRHAPAHCQYPHKTPPPPATPSPTHTHLCGRLCVQLYALVVLLLNPAPQLGQVLARQVGVRHRHQAARRDVAQQHVRTQVQVVRVAQVERERAQPRLVVGRDAACACVGVCRACGACP
jgi:hypothetical protein